VWVHLNGELVEESGALLSVFDRGFLYGDGIFESMRAVAGVVFREGRHLDRLGRSAAGIGLPLPLAVSGFSAAIRDILDSNRLREARIRVTITRGEGRPGDYLEAHGPPSVVISATRFEGVDPALHRSGVRAAVARRRQIPPEALDPAVKSISRLTSVLARREAREVGAFEAILLDGEGRLTEGTVSNLFLVLGGGLMTSPAPAGGLPGITREAVVELARAASIRFSEEPLPAGLLDVADEIFLTNTTWEVLPVVQVGERTVGGGVPGPMTRQLLARYRELVRIECASGLDGRGEEARS